MKHHRVGIEGVPYNIRDLYVTVTEVEEEKDSFTFLY